MSSEEFGWARRDGCVGLTQAVRALQTREDRQPDERDVPPPSVLPHTPASREALRLAQADRQPVGRHRVVKRDGQIVRERP